MRNPKAGESHFFVDESGDGTFYNRDGKCKFCQRRPSVISVTDPPGNSAIARI